MNEPFQWNAFLHATAAVAYDSSHSIHHILLLLLLVLLSYEMILGLLIVITALVLLLLLVSPTPCVSLTSNIFPLELLFHFEH